MNFLEEVLSVLSGAPDASRTPAQPVTLAPLATPAATAMKSMSPALRDFFAPVLESLAQEARRASDPMARINDVGTAIFDSLSSQTPYGQNLARLDASRRDAIKGAGNMFLSILSQERQAANQALAERRLEEYTRRGAELAEYRNTRVDQFDRGLGIRERQGDTRLDIQRGAEERRWSQGDRRIDTAESAEERRRAESNKKGFRTGYKFQIGDAGKELTDSARSELQRRLHGDDEYRDAFEKDAGKAADRLHYHLLELKKDPANVRPDFRDRPTALERNAQFLSRELRIPIQDAIRMAREGRDMPEQNYFSHVYRSVRSQPGATDQDADKAARAAVEARRKFMGAPGSMPNATPPATPPMPTSPGKPTVPMPGSAKPLPMRSGRPDTSKMVPGEIYENSRGQRGRWNGRDFELIE